MLDNLDREVLSTKAGRQSTLEYTLGSSLSADRCASYELDGDARHRQGFYLGSATVRAYESPSLWLSGYQVPLGVVVHVHAYRT